MQISNRIRSPYFESPGGSAPAAHFFVGHGIIARSVSPGTYHVTWRQVHARAAGFLQFTAARVATTVRKFASELHQQPSSGAVKHALNLSSDMGW